MDLNPLYNYTLNLFIFVFISSNPRLSFYCHIIKLGNNQIKYHYSIIYWNLFFARWSALITKFTLLSEMIFFFYGGILCSISSHLFPSLVSFFFFCFSIFLLNISTNRFLYQIGRGAREIASP
jgi:hypothetical protein